MSEPQRAVQRVVVATVTAVRGAVVEDTAKGVAEDLRSAGFKVVRSVAVKPEPEVIQQLISNVSNDNEADVLVLLGGAGIGPRDSTCDAVDAFVERHIEGFGEEYRRWLRDDQHAGPGALLARATAGVYRQCVVFALGGPQAQVRKAIHAIIAPILSEAIRLAAGGSRA